MGDLSTIKTATVEVFPMRFNRDTSLERAPVQKLPELRAKIYQQALDRVRDVA